MSNESTCLPKISILLLPSSPSAFTFQHYAYWSWNQEEGYHYSKSSWVIRSWQLSRDLQGLVGTKLDSRQRHMGNRLDRWESASYTRLSSEESTRKGVEQQERGLDPG